MSTPRAVTESFFPPKVMFGEIELRPFTLAQYMFLQHIRSPLLDNGPCELLDIARVLVVMSRTIRETLELWSSLPDTTLPSLPPTKAAVGAEDDPPPRSEAFEREAWQVADQVAFVDTLKAGEFLRAHIDRGFSTAVPMRMPDGKEGSRPKGQADTQEVSAGN